MKEFLSLICVSNSGSESILNHCWRRRHFIIGAFCPGAVSPAVLCCLTHHHPDPAPGTRGLPGNAGPGTAFRPGGCRPSWSTCPFSWRRNGGTSSFSPSLHLLDAAFPVEDLAVSVKNRIPATHEVHPVARDVTFFAPAGKDRLSSLWMS